MPNVRSLIERLDTTGDFHQFAQATERFGNDLERTWTETENGADLLWFAAAVGVDPKEIIATACELLEAVGKQIETVGWETAQVLKEVHAWQRGERSADEVDRSGWDAYALIARMDGRHSLPPVTDNVTDAAVWLTDLVRDIPSQTPPDLTENDEIPWSSSAWMLVNCLAHALVDHQSFNTSIPSERQQAFDSAMHRFAIAIRERITNAEIQAAAQQRGIWPFS
jgi:hypothetical protein